MTTTSGKTVVKMVVGVDIVEHVSSHETLVGICLNEKSIQTTKVDLILQCQPTILKIMSTLWETPLALAVGVEIVESVQGKEMKVGIGKHC